MLLSLQEREINLLVMRHLWNIEYISTFTGRLSEILEGGRDWFPTVFLPFYEFELEILRIE